MHPHEQEERDFFPRTELQNAYTVSLLEKEPDDTKKINDLVAQGKFCVVEAATVYCKRTDAILGSHKYLLSSHDTYEWAAKMAALHVKGECNPESWIYVVQPPQPKPIPEATVPLGRDEIPF